MNQTILANLALSKIGDKTVKSLGDTSSKEARLVALHYEPVLREVLRAHFWGFATTVRPLTGVESRTYLKVGGTLKNGTTAVTFNRLYLQPAPVDGKEAFSEELPADSEDQPSSAAWDEASGTWVMQHGHTGGVWKRGLDVASPEMVPLRPFSPPHVLVTAQTGANNDIRCEQIQQHLEPVGITYGVPAGESMVVTVSDRNVLVSPALTGARVTGAVQTNVGTVVFNDLVRNAGLTNGKIAFSDPSTSAKYYWDGDIRKAWILEHPGGAKWEHGYPSEPFGRMLVPFAGSAHGAIDSVQPLGGPASAIAAAMSAHAGAAALVTVGHAAGNSGTGMVEAMSRTVLAGGVSGVPTIQKISPGTELLPWVHAFLLPDDFVKVKALMNSESGEKIDHYTLRRVAGKNCLLCNEEGVSLEYVQYVDDPIVFDPLFVAAFVTKLAAKLARAVCGSDDLESKFLQIFETVDMPAARTASAQDSESNENHPLREFLDGNLTRTRGDFFP